MEVWEQPGLIQTATGAQVPMIKVLARYSRAVGGSNSELGPAMIWREISDDESSEDFMRYALKYP